MKPIILIYFIMVANITHGQLQLNTWLSNPNYYVYNNTKDTLYLSQMHVSENTTFLNYPANATRIFDSIQVDGLGSKEIVFERTHRETIQIIMQAFQSTEEISIHKYEIWNIDTKTLLFEAIDAYAFNYQYWQLPNITYPGDPWKENHWDIGSCSYSYTFSIDNTGKIQLANTRYKNTNNKCLPNKKEGWYIFRNGEYVKE